MKKLNFNSPEHAHDRANVKPLTLEEEKTVIGMLENLLNVKDYNNTAIPNYRINLIQRFIHNYENMCHYVAYTGGLYCTDRPDKVTDPENLLFELTYEKKVDPDTSKMPEEWKERNLKTNTETPNESSLTEYSVYSKLRDLGMNKVQAQAMLIFLEDNNVTFKHDKSIDLDSLFQ